MASLYSMQVVFGRKLAEMPANFGSTICTLITFLVQNQPDLKTGLGAALSHLPRIGVLSGVGRATSTLRH
jgi:hypothetical protein